MYRNTPLPQTGKRQQEDGVKSFFSHLEPFSSLARKTSEESLSFGSTSGLLHLGFFGFSLALPHRLVASGVDTVGSSVSWVAVLFILGRVYKTFRRCKGEHPPHGTSIGENLLLPAWLSFTSKFQDYAVIHTKPCLLPYSRPIKHLNWGWSRRGKAKVNATLPQIGGEIWSWVRWSNLAGN